MSDRKVDNGTAEVKLEVRHRIRDELGRDPVVFEGFAGEGRLWRACWPSAVGIAVDRDAKKVERLAAERPGCLCYTGRSERALRRGLGRRVRFDLIDLDCYGQPWEHVRAWFESERDRAQSTILICTDTLQRQIGLSGLPKVLAEPGEDLKGWSWDRYLDRVAHRVREWSQDAELVAEVEHLEPLRRGRGVQAVLWQHLIRVTRG